MNVTLTLDDRLVKEVRKIAAEKETTLSGLVRAYLQQVVAENSTSGRKRQQLEALEEGFRRLRVNIGPLAWKREDLYERH